MPVRMLVTRKLECDGTSWRKSWRAGLPRYTIGLDEQDGVEGKPQLPVTLMVADFTRKLSDVVFTVLDNGRSLKCWMDTRCQPAYDSSH